MYLLSKFLRLSLLALSLAAGSCCFGQEGDVSESVVELENELKTIDAIRPLSKSAPVDEIAKYLQFQRRRIEIGGLLYSTSTTPKLRSFAIKQQFEGYRLLGRYSPENSLLEFWQFCQRHRNNADQEFANLATKYSIILKTMRVIDGNLEEVSSLCRESVEWLRNGDSEKLTDPKFGVLMQTAGVLEKAGKYKALQRLLHAILDTLPKEVANSGLESVRSRAEDSLKRVSLLGRYFPISGTTLTNQKIEPVDLDGKFVLVDFWATWCTPCRKEMPLIRKVYDQYREQGLVVIGVCLDDEIRSVENFVAKNQEINWPILFEKEASMAGFKSPLAVAASIETLPLAILLDSKGRVVSIAARGDKLESLLAEEFGDVSSRRHPLDNKGTAMIMNRSVRSTTKTTYLQKK